MLFRSCALAIIMVAAAAQEEKRGLKIDFDVLRGSFNAAPRKRDGQPTIDLTTENTYYLATIELGADRSPVQVQIDTGSSDLWVMSSNVLCNLSKRDNEGENGPDEGVDVLAEEAFDSLMPPTHSEVGGFTEVDPLADSAEVAMVASADETQDDCTILGSYNTDSPTFEKNETAPKFSITYGDQTYARGDWVSDSIWFGDSEVKRMSFGLVTNTLCTSGIFGLGLEQNEITRDSLAPYEYYNFPTLLKQAGEIEKTVYSLYLSDNVSSTGSVLFGAVDHKKYKGQLQTVPMVSRDPTGEIREFLVVMNSVTMQSDHQNVTVFEEPVAALLDAGTTNAYFPSSMVESLAVLMNADYSPEVPHTQVDCSYQSDSGFLNFSFSGVSISVPIADVIFMENGKCFLAISEQESADGEEAIAILGDIFLKHAYVVFDLEDLEVSLAQVNFTNEESIEVVSSAIPLAISAPEYAASLLQNILTDQATAYFTAGDATTSSFSFASKSPGSSSSSSANSSKNSGSHTCSARAAVVVSLVSLATIVFS